MKNGIAGLALATGLLLLPATAQGIAVPGICLGEPPSAQPFLAWSDSENYFLAPDGDFAAGGAGWGLKGGAAVNDAVLHMPRGSSATSPPICVAAGYSSSRVFGRLLRPAKALRRQMTVRVIEGGQQLMAASTRLGSAWGPSSAFSLGESHFALDPVTGTSSIRLVFGAPRGGALVDDVYVDPRARD